MRAFLVIIVFVASSLSALAQSATNRCDFLKNLKFNTGRDTIIIKATLLDFFLAPPRLIKQKQPSIYKYKFNSYIQFQPENSVKQYGEPFLHIGSDKENVLSGDNLGITVYLTCVVFNESSLKKGEPDCLIIKITPAIHTLINTVKNCNFLPGLHFKNGTDTFVIKVKYHDIFKPGIGLIIADMGQKHLLNAKDYEYGIGFQVQGCNEKIIAPYHFKTAAEEELLKKQLENSTIHLTCVAFQSYYNYGMPFFIIDKFSLVKK